MSSTGQSIVTTISFVAAYCLTHFWPPPSPEESPEQARPRSELPAADETITAQQLITAARGHFEISPSELEDLRWEPDDDVFLDESIDDDTEGAAESAQELAYRATDDGYRRAKESRSDTVAWLETLERGSYRDHAIGGFVRRVFRQDSRDAAKWAATINDPALRERYLRVSLRPWMQVDGEDAERAIRAAGLSEMAVESLLRR